MLLNDLYRRFDQAAAGALKVETVGDGYLAVAGAPARTITPEAGPVRAGHD
jgi:guanylate cyclase